jgi:WD40 repeat protein
MPVDATAFSGVPSVTTLRAMPKANVLLAAAMDRRLVACDLSATATGTARIPGKHLSWSHDNWIHCLDVHPDGARVATGGTDRHIKLWRWGQEKPLADIAAHDDCVRAVAFSPDGKLLASAGDDGRVRLWDVATGKAVATLDGQGRFLDALTWSVDGKQLLCAGGDGRIHEWDVASRGLKRSIEVDNRRYVEDEPLNGGFSYPGGIRDLACSPDGKLLAAVGLTSLHVFDMSGGKEVLKQAGRGFGVAFDPKSERLAFSQEMAILLWDFRTKSVRHTIPTGQLGLFSMSFLDGGQTLISGGCNGWVGVWELPA